jgi:hypothetical protein
MFEKFLGLKSFKMIMWKKIAKRGTILIQRIRHRSSFPRSSSSAAQSASLPYRIDPFSIRLALLRKGQLFKHGGCIEGAVLEGPGGNLLDGRCFRAEVQDAKLVA